jgi:multiple sugar transport system substrate-binding protein
MRKSLSILAGSAAVALALAGCGGGGGGSGGGGSASGTINYWLWDANQQPAYQACADAFATANPGLKVKITQRGWDDYWSTLTTGFVSHTAPDVFTNHLSKYPEFAKQKQLLSLDDAVTKDKINLDSFVPGLADLWVGQDGKRYGLPKDWDTVALFYNKKLAKAAGVTEDEMNNLTWNPQDGGTFE